MSASGTVLITGTNRGIGFGLTQQFARRGWRVFAACRRPDRRRTSRRSPRSSRTGSRCCPWRCATARASPPSGGRLRRGPGRSTCWSTTPGFSRGTIAENRHLSLAPILDAFDVNVAGVIRVTQAVLPLLRAGSRPRIVNITSGGGSLKTATFRRHHSYSLSKAALNMFTRRAAADLKPSGITVVCVSPGFVKTDMAGPDATVPLAEATEAMAKTFESLRPEQTGEWIDRFGQASEFAW